MADFEDNWGLQAIVRGGGGGGSTMRSSTSDSCFLDDHLLDDMNGSFFFGFPEDDDINLFQTNADMLNDDLQQFYKPFYHVSSDSPSSSPAAAVQAAAAAAAVKYEHNDKEPPQYPHVLHHKKQKPSPRPDQSGASCSSDATPNITQTPKYRKRKNQNKRVVVQAIGGEGLPTDMWAWRKYGQKPIKGSPFPRSYYRCSSSKACLARKQVEQSCTEPGVFLISYTAEHNHSQPIRKNALAGTTRQKFPPAPPIQISTTTTPAWTTSENSGNWTALSPISTGDVVQAQAASIEDGCSSLKQELMIKEENNNMKIEDEFFAGLEDLDGLISELASGQQQYSSKMFSMNMNFYT